MKVISVGRDATVGNRSAAFHNDSKGRRACLINYSTPVKPGNIYVVKGHIKTLLEKMPEKSDLGAYIKIIDKTGEVVFHKTFSGTSDWKNFSGRFFVKKGKSIRMEVGLEQARGFFWIDGLDIVEENIGL